jgi:hypothetical protein
MARRFNSSSEREVQIMTDQMRRVVYIEAEEKHSLSHEVARRLLGYSAGQAGFFKHALAKAFRVTFISLDDFLRDASGYVAKNDAIIFSSKSGIRKIESLALHRVFEKISIPISIFVQEAQPSFMIENRIANFSSVIFKREPLRDLECYELSAENRNKIVPTILANPLNPLFNRMPWLQIGKRPKKFGYDTPKKYDAFFIGRVGKNRYQNRVDAWDRLAKSTDIRSIGGLILAEDKFSVPAELITKPMNSKSYRNTVLSTRVNLAFDGIGPLRFGTSSCSGAVLSVYQKRTLARSG